MIGPLRGISVGFSVGKGLEAFWQLGTVGVKLKRCITECVKIRKPIHMLIKKDKALCDILKIKTWSGEGIYLIYENTL